MKLVSCIKRVTQSCILTTITLSPFAFADYQFESIPLETFVNGSYDMENGKVVKITQSNGSRQIVLVEDGVEQVLADSSTFKSDVGLSGGSIFWTELIQTGDDFAKELFVAQNGLISAVTASGAEKEGFTYDAGTAAWVERVNGNFELFYFDGSNTEQLTDNGDVIRKRGSNERFIRMADGLIVFYASQNNVNRVFLWNGLSVEAISPTGVAAGFPDLDNGVVVYPAPDEDGSSEIFQWFGGNTIKLTDDNSSLIKNLSFIENDTVVWTVSSGQFAQSLYAHANNQSQLLSESLINSPVLDNGKIVWTEGEFGVPSRIVEFSAGQVSEITEANNPIGLDASNGFISWRESAEYPLDPFLVLASPEASEQNVATLAPLNSGKTEIDLSQSSTLVLTPSLENIGWTPRTVKFGITSSDGMPLDGVLVQLENGETVALSAWWIAVGQPFTGEPSALIIPQQNRSIAIEWWLEG